MQIGADQQAILHYLSWGPSNLRDLLALSGISRQRTKAALRSLLVGGLVRVEDHDGVSKFWQLTSQEFDIPMQLLIPHDPVQPIQFYPSEQLQDLAKNYFRPISQDHFLRLLAALHRGEKLPPPTIFCSDHQIFLADGSHRIMAMAEYGFDLIGCAVYVGGIEDALIYHLRANRIKKLNPKLIDQRKAVFLLFDQIKTGIDCSKVSNLTGLSLGLIQLWFDEWQGSLRPEITLDHSAEDPQCSNLPCQTRR